MNVKTISDTKVCMTESLEPSNTVNGRLSIAQLLIYMDICACMSAEKFACVNAVTAAMDEVDFMELPTTDEVVLIKTQVNRAFKSSVEVGCSVVAENMWTGEQRTTCSAYFTFVSLMNDKAQPLPPFVPCKPGTGNDPEAIDDLRRYAEAGERKRLRLARKDIINEQIMPLSANESDSAFDLSAKKKSGSCSFTMKTELILPMYSNHMGNMFGGISMSWIANAAKIAACRFSQTPMILERIEDLSFLCPIKVGDRVITRAQVNRTFGSKLEVGVRVERMQLDGTLSYALSSYLIFRTENSSILMQVNPLHENEKKWFASALGRQRLRFLRKTVRTHGESLSPMFCESTKPDLIYSNIRGLLMVFNHDFVNPSKWETLASPDSVSLKFQTLPNHITCLVLSGVISGIPPCFVQSILTDLKNRPHYDLFLKSAEIVCAIDECNDIVRFLHNRQSLSDKSGEMLLLRSYRSDDQGGFIISNRSISHPDFPENDEFVRNEILYSGYVGKMTHDGSTDITYVVQLGTKALSLAVEDLVGASSKPLCNSFLKCIALCQEKFKLK